MIVVCKSKSLSLFVIMIVMCFAMFTLSGCGGSADTSSEDSASGNSSEGNAEVPNDNPDTYTTQSILDGTWSITDHETITITASYGDNEVDMTLITASLTFTNTSIDQTNGTSTVSGKEDWHVFENTDRRTYLGIKSFTFEDNSMIMIQSGADKWRCELDDEHRTVLVISLQSENIIQVTEHRVAVINSISIEYEVTYSMKRQTVE